MRAYLGAAASAQFDPRGTDDIVEVTLGPRFQRLATGTEVNQALVEAGEPTPPPACSTPGGK